jgi:O-antigen ligase
VLLSAIAFSLFVNLAFVVVSRTALVTVPIMFAVFALLHLRWRSIVIILCAAAAFAAAAWQTSPALRRTADTFARDYQLYKEQNIPTSIGLRLEFWRKSLGFFAEAPLIGHGTGATRGLFERVATHDSNQASSEVIGNPHNQTLNVAVQWGIIGVAVLYAMWLLHLLLFRGDGLANWIGLLVVVQNVFTSLFNSHIFDFHEGWMYVLGVGVAGGMVLRARSGGKAGEPSGIVRS